MECNMEKQEDIITGGFTQEQIASIPMEIFDEIGSYDWYIRGFFLPGFGVQGLILDGDSGYFFDDTGSQYAADIYVHYFRNGDTVYHSGWSREECPGEDGMYEPPSEETRTRWDRMSVRDNRSSFSWKDIVDLVESKKAQMSKAQ